MIAYGNVQFHNNKMLCQKEVNDFQIYAMHKFTEHDLIESNGFHRFCINEKIQTKYEVGLGRFPCWNRLKLNSFYFRSGPQPASVYSGKTTKTRGCFHLTSSIL